MFAKLEVNNIQNIIGDTLFNALLGFSPNRDYKPNEEYNNEKLEIFGQWMKFL